MLLTVVSVSGWSFPSDFSLPVQRSVVPFECFAVVTLVVIHRCHVADGSECGGVVFPKRLFPPSQRSVVPFECFDVVTLEIYTPAMLLTVVSVSGWSFPSDFSLPVSARPYHSSALL
jgi:hypothetical protein